MQTLRIGIVGGGIGGLSTAHALAKHGVKHIQIFERSPTAKRHGAFAGFGFGLQPNGLSVLRELGLLDQILPHLYPLDNWINGDSAGIPFDKPAKLSLLRRDYGFYLSGIQRSSLINVLRDSLPPTEGVKIHFNTAIGEILKSDPNHVSPIYLRDQHGNQLGPFDVVICADGISSKLREVVKEKQEIPTYSDTNLFYAMCDADKVPEHLLVPNHTLVQHYGQSTGVIMFGVGPASGQPDPTGEALDKKPSKVVWAFGYKSKTPAEENWNRGTPRDTVDKVLACSGTTNRWGENKMFQALLEATAFSMNDTTTAAATSTDVPSSLAHFGLFYRPPHSPWFRGRVVLTGDAAHATLPHLGQGANMALDDGWALASALATAVQPSLRSGTVPSDQETLSRLQEGLASFEKKRLQKTSKIVKMSKLVGDVTFADSWWVGYLRDASTAFMTRSGLLQRQLATEIATDLVLPLRPR